MSVKSDLCVGGTWTKVRESISSVGSERFSRRLCGRLARTLKVSERVWLVPPTSADQLG